MDLTNEDVADILALLDSLPYDELDLQTPRFRLTLRRVPGSGWARETQVLSEPTVIAGGNGVSSAGAAGVIAGDRGAAGQASETERTSGAERTSEGREAPEADRAVGAELVEVRAPLPGTFYRAPRPGAAPFVEVGSVVGEDTVVGIVETMKLMNSVHAGTRGRVAEICVGNAEFAARGAALMRIERAEAAHG